MCEYIALALTYNNLFMYYSLFTDNFAQNMKIRAYLYIIIMLTS